MQNEKIAEIVVFDRTHAKFLEEAQKAFLTTLKPSDERRIQAEKDLKNIPTYISNLVDTSKYEQHFQKFILDQLNNYYIDVFRSFEQAKDRRDDAENEAFFARNDDEHSDLYSHFEAEKDASKKIEKELKKLKECAKQVKVVIDLESIDEAEKFKAFLRITQSLNNPFSKNETFFKNLLADEDLSEKEKSTCLETYAKYIVSNELRGQTQDIADMLKTFQTDLDKTKFFEILKFSHKPTTSSNQNAGDKLGDKHELIRSMILKACDEITTRFKNENERLEKYIHSYDDCEDSHKAYSRTIDEQHELAGNTEILSYLSTFRKDVANYELELEQPLDRSLLELCDLFDMNLRDGSTKSEEDLDLDFFLSSRPPYSAVFYESIASVFLRELLQHIGNRTFFDDEADELLQAYIDRIGADNFLSYRPETTGLDQLFKANVAAAKYGLLDEVLINISTREQLLSLLNNSEAIQALTELPQQTFKMCIEDYCNIYQNSYRNAGTNIFSQWIDGQNSRLLDMLSFKLSNLFHIEKIDKLKESMFGIENLSEFLSNFKHLNDESKIEVRHEMLTAGQEKFKFMKDTLQTFIDLDVADKLSESDILKALPSLQLKKSVNQR